MTGTTRTSTIARRGALGLLGAVAISSAWPAWAAEQSITVQAWGTSWEQGLQKVATDFEKETGIHVVPVTQSGSADGFARLQSMADAPKIDVWFTTSSLAARVTADHKMFLPIPRAEIPAAGALVAGAETPYWIGAYFYPLSIIYRPTLVKIVPAHWNDLWKPEFKDSLAVPDVQTYQARMLLLAATLNGGGVDDIEPGFAALKRLRPNIAMFYGSDSDARRALAQGEITALVGPPSQAKPLRDAGVDVKVITPTPTPVMFDVMTLVNTPKKEAATRFIAFVVSAASQATISSQFDMGPVNRDVKPSAELAAVLPQADGQITFDEARINAGVGGWNDRFKAEIAR